MSNKPSIHFSAIGWSYRRAPVHLIVLAGVALGMLSAAFAISRTSYLLGFLLGFLTFVAFSLVAIRGWFSIRKLAETDPVTGLPNRRRFDDFFELAWRRAARDQTVLSVLLIDIDGFKVLNDNRGHSCGDECLRRVANAMAARVSVPSYLLARYGGDEFVVVMPSGDQAAATELAETLCRTIDTERGAPSTSALSEVTISVGVASGTPPETASAADGLVQAADRALSTAKLRGGNRFEYTAPFFGETQSTHRHTRAVPSHPSSAIGHSL